MDTENVELMHKCSSKHMGMGTVRLKYDKKLRDGKKRVKLEKSTAGTKKSTAGTKRSLDGLTVARACRPPEARYSPKQFIINLV